MKFFDVTLRADLRTDADLANLVYFGLRGALVVCPEGAAADDSIRAEERFDETIVATDRLAGLHGLVTSSAIGVRSSTAPRRAHPELQDALTGRATAGVLGAIGPIEWPDAEDTAAWQFSAAAASQLPVLVEVRPRTGEGPVRELGRLAEAQGVAPSDVVLLGCDFTNVRSAVAAGFWIVADLSPGGIGWEAGADLAERYGDRLARRMMLAISGHASFDVLAAARFAERLRRGDLNPAVVEGILWGNAHARFAPR